VQKADSLADAAQDIYTVDLRRLKTNARFVLFDACFNGSFHVDDNVAGAYIFIMADIILSVIIASARSIIEQPKEDVEPERLARE